jgi:hypothetical protein
MAFSTTKIMRPATAKALDYFLMRHAMTAKNTASNQAHGQIDAISFCLTNEIVANTAVTTATNMATQKPAFDASMALIGDCRPPPVHGLFLLRHGVLPWHV